MKKSDEHSHQGQTDQLVVAGSAVLLSSIFGNGLNYLFGVFLARFLGADQFGLYALALAFFTTLTLVVPLGMDAGAIKFISEYRTRQDSEGAQRIVLMAGTVTFLTAALTAICLAGLSSLISLSVYHKPELNILLLYVAAGIPLYALTSILLASLQSHHTVRPLIVVRYLWEPIGKFILADLVISAGWGLAGVFGALLIAMLVSLTLTLGFLRTVVRFRRPMIDLWSREEAARLMTYCLPLGVATVFGVVAPRADILMLGSWVNVHEIGIYQAAFQTAAALALILGALESSLTPFFGQLHAQNDIAGLRHMYQTASKLVLLFTVPLFVLLAVFSEEVLSLFGTEFRAGGTLLIVLASGQLLSSAGGSPNNLLLMGGHSRLVMWNTIGVGLLAFGVFACTIPLWGVLGAAIGAASTQVFGVGLRILQVWRIFHIQPFSQRLVKPLLAGLGSAVLGLSLKPDAPALLLPGLGLMMGLVYIVLLIALKLDPQDRQALNALVSKAKMIVAVRA
ncbi:MAG TPA: flippase [Nitrospira sp.]|nr:flippase [Nitrospira sp.]